ncbi:uncharacterized protein BDW70DRAFT_171270 [Aspergillus foveolatus]|uniref:uncharacterized protein n=1 Tax=Aspergillus foveolatus TaxID=210207 RepID=UPI003CCCFA13
MEDVRPTAKWANRMLRPLASIYHRLEKHHEIVTSVLTSKTREKTDAAPDIEQRTRPPIRTKSTESGLNHSDDDDELNDPAWIPGKSMDKRRIRHNYSSRGRGAGLGPRKRSRLLIRSPEAPKTLPGAIEIATPLITGKLRGSPLTETSPSLRMQLFQNRLSDSSVGGSAEHRRSGRTHTAVFRPYQGSWKEILDQSGDPGLVDIAHLLDRIFLKILGNTRVAFDRGGARSLLSTAVRRLPDFIADEQRIQDELEEDCDVDMCDAYFTELEAAYAPGGDGWRPLREAVRAQGIYLVSCMIQNKWITSLAACRLLEECLKHQELDAFESLETKLLATVDTYQHPSALDPPRPSRQRDPIQLLGSYYLRHPARHAYVFEELTKLLTRGAVPPEWMVTTLWKKCVDKAIRSVSREDRGYAAARRLIEAVILSSAGISSASPNMSPLTNHRGQALRPVRPRETRASTTTSNLSNDRSLCPIPVQDALSNLVSSLLAALCRICIARSQAVDDVERSAGLKAREMVGDLAFTVQRAVGNEPILELEQAAFRPLRRGYVLLADCTLQCGQSGTPEVIYQCDPGSRRNIESFFKASASRQDVVRELARFVSQVFHHFGHTQDQGLVRTPYQIRVRVSQLAQLTSTTGVALLLGKVAAETAMELAEKTLDTDDHTWAVELQETVALSQQGEASQQLPSNSHPITSLYRWEDTIGEWVARTPAARLRAVTTAVAAKAQLKKHRRPRMVACSTSSSSASSICSEESVSSVTSSAPSPEPQAPITAYAEKPQARRRGRPRIASRTASTSCASSTCSEEGVSTEISSLSFEKPQVLITGQRRKRGRPRLIASPANSLPAKSCLEDTSSVASSPAFFSRKRPCVVRDSSPRPFKKTYHTRSSERVVSKGDNPTNDPGCSSYQPSSGATHVPAAAQTNTGLRNVLQKNPVGQGDATATNTRVVPVPTLEVVIVNKSPSSNCAATSKNPMQPVTRRTRHLSITPRMSPRLPRRRQSVPARVTRRSLETVIPGSEDDSDDELSFL